MYSDITKPNSSRFMFYLIVSALLLYSVFSPGIELLYYAGDDFRYAFGGFDKACKADDGFEFMLTLGRPLQAYVDCLSFKFAYTMQRMEIIRFIALGTMVLAMGLLADYLHRLRFPLLGAVLAAGALFVLQQSYDDAIISGSICLPLTLVLVLLSYKAINRTHEAFNQNRQKSAKNWRVLAAILLLAAMLTYPAWGFFFATLILTKTLFTPLDAWQNTRREILREMTLFVVVCAMYFMWGYYNMHYHALTPIPTDYHVDHPNISAHEIFNRLFFVLQLAKTTPLFPFNVLAWQKNVIAILLMGGIAVAFYRFLCMEVFAQGRMRSLFTLIQACVFVIGLIILSSGFLLVIPSVAHVEGRVLFGSLAAGWIVVMWGIYQWSYLFFRSMKPIIMFIALASLFAIGGYQANHNVGTKAFKRYSTIKATTDAIQKHLSQSKTLERIHFIIPRSVYPYNKFFLANEALEQVLGRGQYHIAWCSLSRGTPGAEKDHQSEMLGCIAGLSSNAIAITYSYEDEPFTKTANMLIYQ